MSPYLHGISNVDRHRHRTWRVVLAFLLLQFVLSSGCILGEDYHSGQLPYAPEDRDANSGLDDSGTDLLTAEEVEQQLVDVAWLALLAPLDDKGDFVVFFFARFEAGGEGHFVFPAPSGSDTIALSFTWSLEETGGQWQILAAGEGFIPHLGDEALRMNIALNERQVKAIDVEAQAGLSITLRPGRSRGVPFDELRGQWRSEELITAQGREFHVAARVNPVADDGTSSFRIGTTPKGGDLFISTIEGAGGTIDVDGGRPFWFLHATSNAGAPHPVVGGLIGDESGKRFLYLLLDPDNDGNLDREFHLFRRD